VSDTKFSELPATTTLTTATDLIPMVTSPGGIQTTTKTTTAQLLAAPPAIGTTTPAAGNFTTIGATTAGSGAFTTLSASSTVSGAGFSTYLASPPAIGGSVPAAGNFTSLGAAGAITHNTTTNAQSYTTTGAGTITITSGTTGAIDNMAIGANTASTGKFTTGTFSGVVTSLGTYGGIYVYDGATAQSIGTGSTPITLTCFAAAGGANGLASDMTVDKANNKITVTRAGTYQIIWTLSFLSGTNAVQWEAYPFYGSTQMVGAGALIFANNNAQAVCMTAHGYATIPANTDITLRVYHNNGGSVNITVGHANINVTRVGN
jgi:hypothetical protein